MKHLLRTFPEKIRYAFSMWLTQLINKGKPHNNLVVRRILVFKEDEIGDLCNSLHVFTMLKNQFKHAEVTLVCKAFAQSLVANHPHIDKVETDYANLNGVYDVIIDLRGSWQSIKYAIKNRPQLRLDRATVRYKKSKLGKHPHEVITNLQIVAPIIDLANQNTCPSLFLNQDLPPNLADFLSTNHITQFAVLHTGARKALRKWDKFDELASYLKLQLNLDIVFVGDKNDVADITHWQQKIAFKTFNLAGSINLLDFAYLVKKASVYIGNESGPLHIASINDTPCIGLFGPGEPEVFYPWGKNATHLHHILPCNPCGQNKCIQAIPCIHLITLNEVIEKIKTLQPNYEN